MNDATNLKINMVVTGSQCRDLRTGVMCDERTL